MSSNNWSDITNTEGYRIAMEDVANGRVTIYDTVDDFFAEMKAEVEEEAKVERQRYIR